MKYYYQNIVIGIQFSECCLRKSTIKYWYKNTPIRILISDSIAIGILTSQYFYRNIAIMIFLKIYITLRLLLSKYYYRNIDLRILLMLFISTRQKITCAVVYWSFLTKMMSSEYNFSLTFLSCLFSEKGRETWYWAIPGKITMIWTMLIRCIYDIWDEAKTQLFISPASIAVDIVLSIYISNICFYSLVVAVVNFEC